MSNSYAFDFGRSCCRVFYKQSDTAKLIDYFDPPSECLSVDTATCSTPDNPCNSIEKSKS